MKRNVFLTILLAIALVLIACRSNPVERLSEAVIERGADQIFEQATGLEIERGTDDLRLYNQGLELASVGIAVEN